MPSVETNGAGTPVQKRKYGKMSKIITKPMALLYCAKKMEVGGTMYVVG
jgi:hypothetical protein